MVDAAKPSGTGRTSSSGMHVLIGRRMVQAGMAFGAFLRHGSLTWELAKRDVAGRYRGASLGMLWALLGPIMMLIVYSIAFGQVLRSKWPGVAEGGASFTLILFLGLIVHGFFAECFVRSPALVVNNPNYVKRIIFPLEVLPWPMILAALFHFGMNILVFMVFHAVLQGAVPWTIVLLPLVLLPLVALLVGFAWFLASLGVYFRDINQLTPPIATAALFLSSAIIPVESLPQSYQAVFHLNPLTFIIDQVRNVALWGVFPDWVGLLQYFAWSMVFAYAGSFWFLSTRKGFADVL